MAAARTQRIASLFFFQGGPFQPVLRTIAPGVRGLIKRLHLARSTGSGAATVAWRLVPAGGVFTNLPNLTLTVTDQYVDREVYIVLNPGDQLQIAYNVGMLTFINTWADGFLMPV